MVTSQQSDRDLILDATDLVSLIGEHVSLKPRGREHVGLCPFHDDKSPSLAVVTHKGSAFYKCFACGAAGNAIDFAMNYHKMEFREALKFLGQKCGIALRDTRDDAPKNPATSKELLRKAMAAAVKFYQRCLADDTLGAAARSHLDDRSLSAETREAFQLGAAPEGWDHLVRQVERLAKHNANTGEKIPRESFEALGLIRSGQRGPMDGFRNRLLFPIHDELGNPIALGARRLDPNDEPKYLNSPDSPLFSKGRTLYALHRARRTIIETKHAIVVEGYVDAVALHQAGVTNVVATLGTALTRDHARSLQRMAERITVVFDPDLAGERAADRAVETFLAVPVDVRIATLPDGLDADELLQRANGLEEFHAALARGEEALSWMVRRFKANLQSSEGMSAKQQRLQELLRKLGELGFRSMEPIRRSFVMTELSKLTGVAARTLEQAMPQSRSELKLNDTAPAPAAPAPPSSARQRARRTAERNFLAALMADPDAAQVRVALGEEGLLPVSEAFTPEHFEQADLRQIWNLLVERLESGRPFHVQDVQADTDDPGLKGLCVELFQMGSGRHEATDPSEAVRRTAAEFDRLLHDAEPAPDSKRFLDPVDADARLAQLRRGGHNPTAIARNARNDARTETATRTSADLS
ncbi:MAG: DNA primase [Planctomycetes bacterium]|nr:DNA primase [Planctomycetota bacterium]